MLLIQVLKKLYLENPPNDGIFVLIGSLGVTASAMNGFDIWGNSNEGFAILNVNNVQSVYKINLSSGLSTKGVDFFSNITAMALGLGY